MELDPLAGRVDDLHLKSHHIRPAQGSVSYPKGCPCLAMDIELHPAVSLQENTLNVLVAPPELLVNALNSNLNLQRYKVLFVSGNYSRILSRLNRNVTELDVRRAFTSFQLMTILEENHHTFLIVEHDPLLYEDASEMVEYIAQHLRQTSREATVLVYSPSLDPHLEKMTELADRVYCFYEMPKAPAKNWAKAEMKMPGNQATLEAYS
jgi:DNA polymerase I